MLERILKPTKGIQLGSYVEHEGKALFNLTKEKGMEGIVAKRKELGSQPMSTEQIIVAGLIIYRQSCRAGWTLMGGAESAATSVFSGTEMLAFVYQRFANLAIDPRKADIKASS